MMAPRYVLCAAFVLCFTLAAQPTAKSANDRGLRYFASAEWKNALEQFRIAEQLNAADLSIQYNIGLTLFRMGRYQECLEPLRAAGSDPAMADESRYLRGMALFQTGALAKSAQELEVLRAKPKYSEEALYLLVESYRRLRKPAESQQAFRELHERNADSA